VWNLEAAEMHARFEVDAVPGRELTDGHREAEAEESVPKDAGEL